MPSNHRIEAALRLTRGPRVLHVGCTGERQPNSERERKHWLHAALVDAGHSVLGGDINRAGLEWMRTGGYEVILLDAEHIPPEGEKFDSIVAGELIEHLANPGMFLEGAGARLRPDGHLVLTTPNPFGVLYYLAYLKNYRKAFNPEHTCWFDPQTLEQLLIRCGYRVNEIAHVDDIRADIDPSWVYRLTTAVWRGVRWALPRRLRNTIVVDASRAR